MENTTTTTTITVNEVRKFLKKFGFNLKTSTSCFGIVSCEVIDATGGEVSVLYSGGSKEPSRYFLTHAEQLPSEVVTFLTGLHGATLLNAKGQKVHGLPTLVTNFFSRTLEDQKT